MFILQRYANDILTLYWWIYVNLFNSYLSIRNVLVGIRLISFYVNVQQSYSQMFPYSGTLSSWRTRFGPKYVLIFQFWSFWSCYGIICLCFCGNYWKFFFCFFSFCKKEKKEIKISKLQFKGPVFKTGPGSCDTEIKIKSK